MRPDLGRAFRFRLKIEINGKPAEWLSIISRETEREYNRTLRSPLSSWISVWFRAMLAGASENANRSIVSAGMSRPGSRIRVGFKL